MIQAEVAHHSAEGATVGLPAPNELRLASHARRIPQAKPDQRPQAHATIAEGGPSRPDRAWVGKHPSRSEPRAHVPVRRRWPDRRFRHAPRLSTSRILQVRSPSRASSGRFLANRRGVPPCFISGLPLPRSIVYVLRSQTDPTCFYTGLTSNVAARLDAHNAEGADTRRKTSRGSLTSSLSSPMSVEPWHSSSTSRAAPVWLSRRGISADRSKSLRLVRMPHAGTSAVPDQR